jgi:hypothetical protein
MPAAPTDHDSQATGGQLANARHFDPELVGYLLMAALDDHEFKDF